MPETKVSGVPYMVNMYPNFNTIDDTITFYEEIIAELDRENRMMRARMERLEEEINWIESRTRQGKDDWK